MSEEEREGWGTAADAREINKGMIGQIYKQFRDVKWEPHPINKNVHCCTDKREAGTCKEIAYFLTFSPKSLMTSLIFLRSSSGRSPPIFAIPPDIRNLIADIVSPYLFIG